MYLDFDPKNVPLRDAGCAHLHSYVFDVESSDVLSPRETFAVRAGTRRTDGTVRGYVLARFASRDAALSFALRARLRASYLAYRGREAEILVPTGHAAWNEVLAKF